MGLLGFTSIMGFLVIIIIILWDEHELGVYLNGNIFIMLVPPIK